MEASLLNMDRPPVYTMTIEWVRYDCCLVMNGVIRSCFIHSLSAFSFNHFNCHPGEGRGLGFQLLSWLTVWVPAFAGMTKVK
jgi:hypothetical protein